MLVSVMILSSFFSLGAARNHSVWSMRQANNILSYATETPAPIRFRGVIDSEIEIEESERGPRIPPWMEVDRSLCFLRCETLDDGGVWNTISGRIRADIAGHLVHVQIGDHVQILGELSIPNPPKNPGSLDYRKYLKSQGVDALLSVDHPASVTLIEPGLEWQWCIQRWRKTIREECRLLFMQHLSKESRPLAASILLGDRTRMTDDLRSAFTESGTMHLLAISGMHVGILVGMLLFGCRVLNLSPRTTAVFMITAVLMYSMLTNHRPPVMRAALLSTITLIGYARYRASEGMNTLAICASMLLLWKPLDLFDVGAQLSFLAVGAILWSMTWKINQRRTDGNQFLEQEQSTFVTLTRPLGRWLLSGYSITGAIWFCTLPLTIFWFHLIAPVGFVINVLLIPLVAVALWLGYLFMIIGFLLPGLCGLIGYLFDLSLQWLLGIVDYSRELPLSHFYLPSIPAWWLIGFYLLLSVAWQLVGTKRSAFFASRAILIWTLLGLAIGTPRPHTDKLRCTFLAVGHGLSVVLELPSGETILFDAGTLGDGRRAERIVEQYLWTRNISHIDAVIVSHADHDHFNGLFGLLEVFPTKTLFFTQHFLDFKQTTVADLCEVAFKHHVPVRLVKANDQLNVISSNSVQLNILHPESTFHSKSDNANSIVLEVTFAGRRILLTGDLEKDGLLELLQQPSQPIDIFMAPHHGSKNSISTELFDWADARYAVVSTNDTDVIPRMDQLAPPKTSSLSTGNSGAITFEISPGGKIELSEFCNFADN